MGLLNIDRICEHMGALSTLTFLALQLLLQLYLDLTASVLFACVNGQLNKQQ